MALLRSVATVGSYTLVSRVLGFIRDILTAAILGAGPVADAFFVAQRLPNLFRSLFAEGAFSAAFVPLASGALAEGGRPGVRAFAEEAFAVLFAVLLAFVLLGEIFMPWVMAVIAPGFGGEPGKFDLVVTLTRITQLNLVISTALASLLAGGSVSYLYYADRLNQLPLGVVGIAVGTAILPPLSRQVQTGDVAGAAATQNRGVELALLLTLPAAAALIVLAHPILTVLFERGAFGPAEAAATAAALAAYAVGLPAFVLVKVLAPGFYAHRNTATPVKVAIAAVALNFVLTVVLMQFLAHVGVAIALS